MPRRWRILASSCTSQARRRSLRRSPRYRRATALLFAVLYRVLPDVRLEWRDVAIGSIVTAVLFAIGQRLIGLYLGNSTLASPFGAAGTIAIILVWVYYSTQIVLLGAELTLTSTSEGAGGLRAQVALPAMPATAP